MKHRIVVLGAGYSGGLAAGRLARRLHPADTEITLVNAEPDFVERVRLHQLAVGQELKHRPLQEMYAGTGVNVRRAQVTALDVDRRTVALLDERGPAEICYDTLVYALGSTAADRGVPGGAEYAIDIAGRRSALRLRERLGDLEAGGTVLIVGGGPTGIEAVAEIAEARTDLRVAIATRGAFGDWLSDKGRQHLREVFDRLGIAVHEFVDVTRVDATGVTTASGEVLSAGITVWANGFGVHPIAAASTLEVGETGRIVVDGAMRSVSHPDVYAIGDAALAEGAGGKPLRMSCASGEPMGQRAADAIIANLTGSALPESTIGYHFQCISLGRRDGIIQFVTPDDRARPSIIKGPLAARVKETICRGAAWVVAHPTMMIPGRRRHLAAPGKVVTLTA